MFMQVKTAHALFPKKIITDASENMPGGTHIVLTGVGPQGTPLMAIGYRYSSKSTLYFICTQNAGTTRPGDPYEMKFTDTYGNVCVRFVDRPKVLSEFFNDSNIIDTHNMARQSELALEKKWVTHNPYFRIHTTIEAMNLTDVWYLARHHNLFQRFGLLQKNEDNVKTPVPIKKFSGIVARQMLHKAKTLFDRFPPPSGEDPKDLPASIVTDELDEYSYCMSSMTDEHKELYRDKHGKLHTLYHLPKTKNKAGKVYRKARFCQKCRIRTGKQCNTSYLCLSCNKPYCIPSERNGNKNCFREHVINCGPFEARKRKRKS